MNRRILNGWKEISGYIQRSVRTVQRWEQQMGMPVYRPATKECAVVVAFTDELDAWLYGTSTSTSKNDQPESEGHRKDEAMAHLFEKVSSLVADAAELASRVCMVKEQLRQLLPPADARSSERRRPPRRAPGQLLQFPAAPSRAEAAR